MKFDLEEFGFKEQAELMHLNHKMENQQRGFFEFDFAKDEDKINEKGYTTNPEKI